MLGDCQQRVVPIFQVGRVLTDGTLVANLFHPVHQCLVEDQLFGSIVGICSYLSLLAHRRGVLVGLLRRKIATTRRLKRLRAHFTAWRRVPLEARRVAVAHHQAATKRAVFQRVFFLLYLRQKEEFTRVYLVLDIQMVYLIHLVLTAADPAWLNRTLLKVFEQLCYRPNNLDRIEVVIRLLVYSLERLECFSARQSPELHRFKQNLLAKKTTFSHSYLLLNRDPRPSTHLAVLILHVYDILCRMKVVQFNHQEARARYHHRSQSGYPGGISQFEIQRMEELYSDYLLDPVPYTELPPLKTWATVHRRYSSHFTLAPAREMIRIHQQVLLMRRSTTG